MNIFRNIFRGKNVGENNDNISMTNNIQNNSSMPPIKILLIDIKSKGRNEYPL